MLISPTIAKIGRKIISMRRLSSRLPESAVRGIYRICNRNLPSRGLKYDPIDDDPLQLYGVNPSKISFESTVTPKHHFGYVTDEQLNSGDALQQHAVFQAIRSRIEGDVTWDETPYTKIYPDVADDDTHFQVIDELIETINDEGYRSQRSLLKENPQSVWEQHNDGLHPIFNEVYVNISREGELLWRTRGQHRLAIAKTLEIDEIPVMVGVRHTDAPKNVVDPYSEVD